MIRTLGSLRIPLALTALTTLFAACAGELGGVSPGGGADVQPFELVPVAPEPGPFGLLSTQLVAWRSSESGDYTITLEPGGDRGEATVIESGTVTANETVGVFVSGYELSFDAPSPITFTVTDSSGTLATNTRQLVMQPIAELPLGVGLHNDLSYDATRGELLVSEVLSGTVKILDVGESGSGSGQVVALIPPGPDAGPFFIAVTPDGRRSFSLNRTTLLEFDLQSLQVENNLFLQGGFEPSGLAVTPNSERLYIGYFHTLLQYQIAPQGNPPAVEATGITDGLVLGGDVAVTPDGAFVFYAWFGDFNEGLWVVDANGENGGINTLIDEKFFDVTPVPEVFLPVTPKVSIAQSGEAAYTGGLAGILKIRVEAPEFPVELERNDLALTGLATAASDGHDIVLTWEAFGTLTILDADLRTLGDLDLTPLLIDRGVVDQEGGRLFLISQLQQTVGQVLVIPLR